MVSNNFMENQMGGWVGGAQAVLEIQVEGGGGAKNMPSIGGGGSSSFGNPGGRGGSKKRAFHWGAGFFLE